MHSPLGTEGLGGAHDQVNNREESCGVQGGVEEKGDTGRTKHVPTHGYGFVHLIHLLTKHRAGLELPS